MTASPSPMSACQLSIAVASESSGMGAVPPTAYSATKPSDAVGTDTSAATAAAGARTLDVSRWLAGAAVDRTFPLRSMLLTGEVYARRPLRDGADVEWNAGVGSRYQLTPRWAIDGGLGRRLTGDDRAWSLTAGAAWAFGMPWRGR